MTHAAGQRVREVLSVSNDPAAIERAEERLLNTLDAFHYPKASLFAVRLCLHEAISNSFQHGHRSLPASTPVRLAFDATPGQVEISIEDQGPGFNPADVPDPTLDENLERGSGRGLLLIRAYMATAEYNDRGNSLRMVYKRPGGA